MDTVIIKRQSENTRQTKHLFETNFWVFVQLLLIPLGVVAPLALYKINLVVFWALVVSTYIPVAIFLATVYWREVWFPR